MIIDISRPIHNKMPIYPGNPEVGITQVRPAAEGVSALSEIVLGSHTGTHIDSPLHIDPQGSGIEAYTLEQYVGDAEVVEVDGSLGGITASDIPKTTSERILLKTKNSYGNIDTFDPDFAALTEDGARELIARNIRLVGIDGPSIKRKGVTDAVHELLLNSGIVVLEGLWLKDVVAGRYTLMCLPLLIAHLDGVPVRAVLDSKQ